VSLIRKRAQVLGEVEAASREASEAAAVLIVCATLSATTGLAHAGACADQITELRQAAKLGHQPTPESVRQAQTYAQLMFAGGGTLRHPAVP
jgi:hypothetical protein